MFTCPAVYVNVIMEYWMTSSCVYICNTWCLQWLPALIPFGSLQFVHPICSMWIWSCSTWFQELLDVFVFYTKNLCFLLNWIGLLHHFRLTYFIVILAGLLFWFMCFFKFWSFYCFPKSFLALHFVCISCFS